MEYVIIENKYKVPKEWLDNLRDDQVARLCDLMISFYNDDDFDVVGLTTTFSVGTRTTIVKSGHLYWFQKCKFVENIYI